MLHRVVTERVKPDVDEPYLDLVADKAAALSLGEMQFEHAGFVPLTSAGFDAFSVILDLEGFTAFCSQSDPHLFVPDFVSNFSHWLFRTLIDLSISKEDQGRVAVDQLALHAPLPIFSKFLGDGYLLIWEADPNLLVLPQGQSNPGSRKQELEGDIINLVAIICDLVDRYPIFVSKIENEFSLLPRRLRCGAARGFICSIEDGADFVGPSINQASRLQKLGPLGMAVSAKGLPATFGEAELLSKRFRKERIRVRGSGEEVVFVNETEWLALSLDQQDQARGR